MLKVVFQLIDTANTNQRYSHNSISPLFPVYRDEEDRHARLMTSPVHNYLNTNARFSSWLIVVPDNNKKNWRKKISRENSVNEHKMKRINCATVHSFHFILCQIPIFYRCVFFLLRSWILCENVSIIIGRAVCCCVHISWQYRIYSLDERSKCLSSTQIEIAAFYHTCIWNYSYWNDLSGLHRKFVVNGITILVVFGVNSKSIYMDMCSVYCALYYIKMRYAQFNGLAVWFRYSFLLTHKVENLFFSQRLSPFVFQYEEVRKQHVCKLQ